jgi:acetyl esterase/lipase
MKNAFVNLVFATASILTVDAAAPLRGGADDVELRRDVAYLGTSRAEKMDVYLPPGHGSATARAIPVVYFHGGGWVKGDKADPREVNIGTNLARSGFAFFSANYTLGPRSWPQNFADCRAAIRYVRAHAADYGVDPDALVVMGASAGAHLALLSAYTATDPRDRVAAVVEFYGITDLLTRRRVKKDGTPLAELNDSHAVEVLGRSREQARDLWVEASPTSHVTPQSPPTFIVHGLADSVVDYTQAVELDRRLTAVGVAHELILLPGVGHQFDLETWQGTSLPTDIRPVLYTFLRTHTRAAQSSQSPPSTGHP